MINLNEMKLSDDERLSGYQKQMIEMAVDSCEKRVKALIGLTERTKIYSLVEDAKKNWPPEQGWCSGWIDDTTGVITIYFYGKRVDYSAFVTSLAEQFNEAPDVEIGEFDNDFMAKFSGSKVTVRMTPDKDSGCKFIETKEEIIKRRPHPSCIAAVKQLEELKYGA